MKKYYYNIALAISLSFSSFSMASDTEISCQEFHDITNQLEELRDMELRDDLNEDEILQAWELAADLAGAILIIAEGVGDDALLQDAEKLTQQVLATSRCPPPLWRSRSHLHRGPRRNHRPHRAHRPAASEECP